MAKVQITEEYLQAIADAIREKTGETETLTPSEMAEAISNISGGGGQHPEGDDYDMLVANLINNATIPSNTVYSDPYTQAVTHNWFNRQVDAYAAHCVAFWNLKSITQKIFNGATYSYGTTYAIKNLYLPSVLTNTNQCPFAGVSQKTPIKKLYAPFFEGDSNSQLGNYNGFCKDTGVTYMPLLRTIATIGSVNIPSSGDTCVIGAIRNMGSCMVESLTVDMFNKLFSSVVENNGTYRDFLYCGFKSGQTGVIHMWLLKDWDFTTKTFSPSAQDVDLVLRDIQWIASGVNNIFDSTYCKLKTLYIDKVGSNLRAPALKAKYLVFGNCSSKEPPSITGGDLSYLTAIVVPNNLVSAFKAATNWSNYANKIYGRSDAKTMFSDIYLPNTKEFTKSEITYGDTAYEDFEFVKGSSVTRLGMYSNKGVFEDSDTIKSVYFENLKTIGNYAFKGSTLNTLLTKSITTIAKHAFKNATNFVQSYWPALTSIQEQGFYGCTNLTAFNAPNLTTIETGVWSDCSKLAAVNLPLLSGNIGENTFFYCTNLKYLNIPKINKVGRQSFGQCTSLKYLDLGRDNNIGAEFNTYSSGGSDGPFAGVTFALLVLRVSPDIDTVPTSLSALGFALETGGKILVPRSKVEGFKTATNWSVYASAFDALEDYTVDGTISGDINFNKTIFYTNKRGLGWEDFTTS